MGNYENIDHDIIDYIFIIMSHWEIVILPIELKGFPENTSFTLCRI